MSTAVQPAEFRRYPKNTWRLVRLRERYLALRFTEDQLTEEQQLYVQHTHKALRMKKSTDQLRSQLIENLSTLDLNSDKKHSDFLKKVDDQDSISSGVPSLTSQSTVSPMSPTLFNDFTFQSPTMRIEEQPSSPLKFKH